MSFHKHRLIGVLSAVCFLFPLHAQTVTWRRAPFWTDAEVIDGPLLRVKNDGKYGLVRTDGTQLAFCEYDLISEAREGYCLLLNAEGGGLRVKGILDVEKGNIATPGGSYNVSAYWPYFSEGLLNVESFGRWGFIAPDGSVQIPFEYYLAFPFSQGYAAVLSPDGYFQHIDKRKEVLDKENRNLLDKIIPNKFRFASSFVQTDHGPMAIVEKADLMGKSYLQGRNASGDLVGDKLPVAGNRKEGYSKRIEEKDYILEFNDAWQPVLLRTASSTTEYHAFEKPGPVFPVVPSLSVTMEEGGYGLRYEGQDFLAGQFESLIPVTRECILAKQGGLWGILQLSPFEKVTVEALPGSPGYSHAGGAQIPVRVSVPGSLVGKTIRLRCQGVEAREEGGMRYTLTVPVRQDEAQAEVEVEADGIRYQPVPIAVDSRFKPGFRVNAPATVTVRENDTAVYTISITNTATTPSDYAEVFVNGSFKERIGPLEPRRRASVTLSARVSQDEMGDSDRVTRRISVEIREEGCPPVRSQHEIIFSRY